MPYHKTILIILFAFSSTVKINAQYNYFQDCYNGGVVGDGYNASYFGGLSNISLPIPNSSEVRKILLFANIYYPINSSVQFAEKTIFLNGNAIHMSSNNQIGNPIIMHSMQRRVVYLSVDITHLASFITDNNIIDPNHVPIQDPTGPVFADYYILLFFEDLNLPQTCVSVTLNQQDTAPNVNYDLSSLNEINSNLDIGLAVHSSSICNNDDDRYNVFINNSLIGSIGGQEENTEVFCAGVIGSFKYLNGELMGIGNDVGDENMNGLDAIANIQTYFQSIQSISIGFEYTSNFGPNSNLINQLFLTYTSPCQPFEATLLTSDTTTCPNNPLQLGVTVPNTISATYEWLPQTNLSCYDCPNPVFLGNSTTNYTVRIWASDSCSKVLPVHVRLLPEPNFESIEITESVCGGATGEILVTSTPLSVQNLFQLNDGTPQNNGNFSNLAAGEYTITVTNAVGCSKDSVVVVGEFNNVQAAFSVNPTTGTAPLDISITNQSQNATEYFWDFSDEDGTALYQGVGSLSGVEAPLAGTYTLTLIAGNGTPHCNDTASVVILVKEPFEVFAYTFVTDDAESYQIFLSGVSEYRYSLYSMDGKLVYQKSGSVENAGHVDLWEIGSMASSMYLFRVWVKGESGDEEEIKGKLVVVR